MLGMSLVHQPMSVSASKHFTVLKPCSSFSVHPLSSAVGGSPSSLIGCVGGGCGSRFTSTLYSLSLLSWSTITHGQLTAPILMPAYVMRLLTPSLTKPVFVMSRSGAREA